MKTGDWILPVFITVVLAMGVFAGMAIHKNSHSQKPCVTVGDYPCCWDVPKGHRCVKCRDAKI